MTGVCSCIRIGNFGIVLSGLGCFCHRWFCATNAAAGSLFVAPGGLAGDLAGFDSSSIISSYGTTSSASQAVLLVVRVLGRIVHGHLGELWLLLGLALGGPVVQSVGPGLFVEDFPAGGGLLRGETQRWW